MKEPASSNKPCLDFFKPPLAFTPLSCLPLLRASIVLQWQRTRIEIQAETNLRNNKPDEDLESGYSAGSRVKKPNPTGLSRFRS